MRTTFLTTLALTVVAVLSQHLVSDRRLQTDVLDVGRASRTMLDGVLGDLSGFR